MLYHFLFMYGVVVYYKCSTFIAILYPLTWGGWLKFRINLGRLGALFKDWCYEL